MDKKLTRNTADSVFGGVCSGMAAYIGMDVTLMRILWVVVTVVTWGFMIGALYLILWAVLPAQDGSKGKIQYDTQKNGGKGIVWLAAVLIGLGAFLLLNELVHIDLKPYLFALGLIVAGVVLIWSTTRKKK